MTALSAAISAEHHNWAARILVVDDDEAIAETLKENLIAAGHDVVVARDGPEGLKRARTWRPDLILLDLMLPGMNGLEVCRSVRKASQVPIIMLTAMSLEVDRVVGLEVGADDYVTKPFSLRELMARVNAVLRRRRDAAEEEQVPEVDRLGNFVIDRAAHLVAVDGCEVKLAAREFSLLSFLLSHPGRVYSRYDLVERVWGPDFVGEAKTVDVHVRWLRQKLAGEVPFSIVTVRGSGYRLDRNPA